jgi:ribosomal protein L16 Arg81 hydroxylase
MMAIVMPHNPLLSIDLMTRGAPIALLRPNSEAARFVSIVEGKTSQAHQSISASLSEMIRVADEEELEAAMLQIVRRMFRRQTAQTR